MKAKKIVCLIAILLMVSCSSDGIIEKMEQIKTIGNHDPEKALVMLDSLELDVRDKSEYARNKYDLLRIRLHDKANHMPSSDLMIKGLVAYFEDNGSIPEKQDRRSITMPVAHIATFRTRPAPWRTFSSRLTLPLTTRRSATPLCCGTLTPTLTTFTIW